MSQDIGWLRWWCNLYADAWIEYQPFFAKVNAGASLGLRAEVKLAGIKVGLSFELGVDIGMWWVPEFGGTFTVHLWCLSYTGRWGVELPKDKPQQKWTDFQRQVPVPTTLTYGYNVEASELVKKPTTVESYKLKDDHLLAGGNGGFEDESAGKKQLLGPWLASANGFTFTVRSAMPCSAVYVNDEKQATGNTLDLRQVGITDRTAQFWITVDHVVKHDDRPEETKAVNIHRGRKWTFTPHKTNVPVAMYGKPGGETRPDKNIDTDKQQRLTNRLDGLQLQVPEPALRCAATVNDAPLRSSAADLGTEKVPYAKNVPYANYPLLPKDEPCGAQPSKVKDALTRIAQGLTHSGPRNDLFTALGRAGVQPTGANQALTRYPGAVSSLLIADPLIVTGDE